MIATGVGAPLGALVAAHGLNTMVSGGTDMYFASTCQKDKIGSINYLKDGYKAVLGDKVGGILYEGADLALGFVGGEVGTALKAGKYASKLEFLKNVGSAYIKNFASPVMGIIEKGRLGRAIDTATEAKRAFNAGERIAEGARKGDLVFQSGKDGERYLQEFVGGKSQQYFPTSQGGRYIDQLSDGIAYESKVGYASKTKFIEKQVLKDAELIRSGDIIGAEWNFFRSGKTGKIGPSEPLRELLEQNGISYKIHY